MCVKNRIKEYCKIKNIPVSTFEKECGMSNGYVNAMRKGLSESKLNVVLRTYPDLNKVWLLTGEGEMLKNSCNFEKNEQNLTVSDMYREICRLNKIVEKQQDTITEQMGLISEQSKTINRLVFQRQDGAVTNRTA